MNLIKKIAFLISLTVFVACNSEDAPDCLKTEGASVSQEIQLPFFNAVTVEDNISLVIKQAPQQKVVITSGANLIDNIIVKVENQTLFLQDDNGCNWVRDYEGTVVYIEVPELTTLRNASTGSISSQGTLVFSSLDLISNTEAGVDNPNKSGDFNLQIVCERLAVGANGLSIFTLSGYAKRATISFTDETPRFEGANLLIDKLTILQRSATYMKVHPVEQITGEIRGTGDVISVNHPPVVEVTQYYTGQLIFEE